MRWTAARPAARTAAWTVAWTVARPVARPASEPGSRPGRRSDPRRAGPAVAAARTGRRVQRPLEPRAPGQRSTRAGGQPVAGLRHRAVPGTPATTPVAGSQGGPDPGSRWAAPEAVRCPPVGARAPRWGARTGGRQAARAASRWAAAGAAAPRRAARGLVAPRHAAAGGRPGPAAAGRSPQRTPGARRGAGARRPPAARAAPRPSAAPRGRRRRLPCASAGPPPVSIPVVVSCGSPCPDCSSPSTPQALPGATGTVPRYGCGGPLPGGRAGRAHVDRPTRPAPAAAGT